MKFANLSFLKCCHGICTHTHPGSTTLRRNKHIENGVARPLEAVNELSPAFGRECRIVVDRHISPFVLAASRRRYRLN